MGSREAHSKGASTERHDLMIPICLLPEGLRHQGTASDLGSAFAVMYRKLNATKSLETACMLSN